MKYTPPTFELNAFNCPHCQAYAAMNWWDLQDQWSDPINVRAARCACCKEINMWHRKRVRTATGHQYIGIMVFPEKTISYFPEADMPDDVKRDFEEAASIFDDSPRGAAALLRLCLQKMCKHLGQKGVNIDEDIRALAKSGQLPETIIKVADTVRLTGNNAVHPGEMSEEDIDFVASKLFGLINFIVRKGITEPREIQALYEMTPESARKVAEAKDAKAKSA